VVDTPILLRQDIAIFLRSYGLNLIPGQCQRKNHAILPILSDLWKLTTADVNDALPRSGSAQQKDIEKASLELSRSATDDFTGDSVGGSGLLGWRGRLKAFEQTLVGYNLEARGIQRVLPEDRHTTQHLGFLQICLLWVSINLTANNLTLGMLYVLHRLS
jgi:hypothetical protein